MGCATGGGAMFCSKCGVEVPDGSRFCPSCGQPLAPKPPTTGKGAPASPSQPLPQPSGGSRSASEAGDSPTLRDAPAANSFSRGSATYRQTKKKPWLIPVVVGCVALVAIAAVGIAFALGSGKPVGESDAKQADPIVGYWNIDIDTGNGFSDMQVIVRDDKSISVSGSFADSFGLADSAYAWSYEGDEGDSRIYRLSVDGDDSHVLFVPKTFGSNGFEGRWAIESEQNVEPMYCVLNGGMDNGSGEASNGERTITLDAWIQDRYDWGKSLDIQYGEASVYVCYSPEAEKQAALDETAASDGQPSANDGVATDTSTAYLDFDASSSCGNTCHTPMDPYIASAGNESGQMGTDKYGNEVSNSASMLCASHGSVGLACLDCHQLTQAEKSAFEANWISGNYQYPLYERTDEDLVEARGLEADEFCLNEGCHNLTRQDLIEATSDMERNPHVAQHGEIACTECHKAHRASVNYCSQCHSDAEIPDGWLTTAQANKLEGAA